MRFTVDEIIDAIEFVYDHDLGGPEEMTEEQVGQLFSATLDDCRMWRCVDCQVNVRDEYYIVSDELWKTHGASRGMLCVGCLEQRAGRTLLHTDFTDAPVNRYWSRQSDRLQSRIMEQR